MPDFPEENLLSAAADGGGFFITTPGALLKGGRYKVLRKLGRGRRSNTFLVEDLESTSPDLKYLAAKVLSASATTALENGVIRELKFLQAVAKQRPGPFEPLMLPIVRDHFAQRGPHGVHYCLLTDPMSSDVRAFRVSAPSGKLAIHIVKPIVACVIEALKSLHSCNIIHADVKADNVLFLGPRMAEIEETIANEPPLAEGTFELAGKQYPILRSQPFQPFFRWDDSPFTAETIQVVLSGLDSALWANKPKPPGDIGACALRAPENVVRAECGKEIDIWAVGCMLRVHPSRTYELLTGEVLFRPQPTARLTADESLLLLQCSVTGETHDKKLAAQARAKEQYFDREGDLIKAKTSPYPRQTIHQLLTQHSDLSTARIDAAARFIGDCLRLNPGDRMDINQLEMHDWLETAFVGCMDHDGHPSQANTAIVPPRPRRKPAL